MLRSKKCFATPPFFLAMWRNTLGRPGIGFKETDSRQRSEAVVAANHWRRNQIRDDFLSLSRQSSDQPSITLPVQTL